RSLESARRLCDGPATSCRFQRFRDGSSSLWRDIERLMWVTVSTTSRLQVYARPQISRAHRHGYIPREPIQDCPRVFALERWDLGQLGDSPMSSKSIRTFANAPWGRKRFLLPLPILSVLLLGTALASPGILRMTVNVFDDPNLTILASVQNVVHPSGPTGKLVGLMTVTNHASTATRITVGTATIASVTDGN